MKRIKKIAASIMAVAAMATSMMGINASAVNYTAKKSWRTYLVLNNSHVPNQQAYTTCTFPSWGKGYYTYCSYIEGDNNRMVTVTGNTTSSFNITTTGYSQHISNSATTNATFTFRASTSNYISANGSVGYSEWN